ncbi:uncharacterized protein LOC129775873 isoform X2 [Toxorhynchites rutilus septentrionalis]|nr:uncharacterized protein LOC129775873 isoform X2 [Toxorhynchites rutilus septentrionalis]
MEGSIVPTKEPCLMCKCQSKTLICALKVCPEQPIPPPRGCILIHKSGACCPYLQCSKMHLASKNPGDRKKVHFLDYYEKAAEERLSDPNSYLRRSDDEDVEENGACIVNGTVYKSGSAMITSSHCSYCYCINGRQRCVKPKCALPSPRCAPVFTNWACCPVRYDCSGKIPTKEIATSVPQNLVRRINNRHYMRTVERKSTRNASCVIEGKTYPEGERIATPEPCEVCFCIRGAKKCTPKKCAPPIKGCTPRVPRGECCAVRYDCKHGDQKTFARKIEDEEESFDFFSILFGPDPDEPKPVAKNITEVVITEAPPVSTSSEKSFFDFLKAGLEYIDNNSDDLLETTSSLKLAGTTTEMIPTTEISTEIQTVRVEIIQEPQTIYIEKPDFNFPSRSTLPPVFRTVTSPRLTISTSTTTTAKPTTTTVQSTTLAPPTSTSTITTTTSTSTAQPTTELTRLEKVTSPRTTTSTSTTTTAKPTTITDKSTTPLSTTSTSTIIAKSTTESTRRETVTSPTTTTPRSTSTTDSPTSTTVKLTTPSSTTKLTTTTESTTVIPSTKRTTTTTEPLTTTTTTMKPTTTTTITTTTPKPSTTPSIPDAVQTKNLTMPVAIDLTKAEPEFQDLESDSLLKENITEISNSLVDLETPQSSTEPTTLMTETIPATTTEEPKKKTTPEPILPESGSTATPIDVVIKIDDWINKAAVESILNSLNAKIESVAKTEFPSVVTTPIATQRPNDKFVGYDIEKLPTTVISATTSAASSSTTVSTTTEEASTEGPSEEMTTTDADYGDTSTVDYSNDESLVEDMITTDASVEATSTESESVENEEETTVDDFEATSTIATTTFLDEDKMEHKSESDTELPPRRNTAKTTTDTPMSSTTPKVKKNATKPSLTKENNLLSVLLTELSNIFESTKNDSGKQNSKNRTEPRPVTPKPIPIGEFHRPSSIPSILEADISLDYGDPTLPPSLPNLKIIPFLPADAVKKSEPPIALAAPYDFYKPNPTSYPIITESYEPYGVLGEHDIHPGMPFKPPKYDYSYDSSLSYPALTENYDVDAKNNQYNAKIIRDKYDTINDSDYDYDTDTLAKYDIHSKQELFKNELKKFIPTTYEAPKEGIYVPVYDKYGVGYPEKNVYYPNHKDKYEPVVFKTKLEITSEHPLYRLEEKPAVSSGFSPPTKTEGGFVPKDHNKDDYYYEQYMTTAFPIELTTEDHSAHLSFNGTADALGGETPELIPFKRIKPEALKFQPLISSANPFIDVIRTEPAPPLISLIEDKEKLFSVYHSVAKNNYSSLDDLLDNDNIDSAEYDKQIISITTDANYLSVDENSVDADVDHAPTQNDVPVKGFTMPPPELDSAEYIKNTSEPEPSGMFSLENVLSYLFRDEDPTHGSGTKNTTSSSPAFLDGVPPFRTLPSRRIGSVYDSSSTSIEASLGEVELPSDEEEQHEGTVTLKVESAKNDTKDLYRPSLMDLPFLSPNFHTGGGGSLDAGTDTKNDIDRFGFDPDVEHYQVISDGPPNTIPNTDTYVVNPVDINKLKQHHSEGTAEITMKSKVYSLKDTVGILKLAGCNIYGRMYRVGRIISELSGPCLECKCTEVGVHCTPLHC